MRFSLQTTSIAETNDLELEAGCKIVEART